MLNADTPPNRPSTLNWIAPVICSLVNIFLISPYSLVLVPNDGVSDLKRYQAFIHFGEYFRLLNYIMGGWKHGFWLMCVPALISYLAYHKTSAKFVWGWVFGISWLFWQCIFFAILIFGSLAGFRLV